MKKTLLGIAIVGVAVLALGVAGFAYAQSQTPQFYGPGMPALSHAAGMGSGDAYGMMGAGYGYGHGSIMGAGHGMGSMSHAAGMGGYGEMGALHDYMYPAMAAALGLTPEEFDARHEAGETFWNIAEAQGLSTEEAWNLMQAARNEALQQAVADGIITQEFADGILEHMDAMHSAGFGPGSGHCDGEG